MILHLYGVPYKSRPWEVDWFEEPSFAIKRANQTKAARIIWLTYDSEFSHPLFGGRNCWQTSIPLYEFHEQFENGNIQDSEASDTDDK